MLATAPPLLDPEEIVPGGEIVRADRGAAATVHRGTADFVLDLVTA